jgi:hypothetical protein
MSSIAQYVSDACVERAVRRTRVHRVAARDAADSCVRDDGSRGRPRIHLESAALIVGMANESRLGLHALPRTSRADPS